MSSFILNPYDTKLDLANKDDRKLYQDACKGLTKENQFDGQKKNIKTSSNSLKNISRERRYWRYWKIIVAWDNTASDPEAQKLPTIAGMIDRFTSKQVTQAQVQAQTQIELVWVPTTHGTNTQRFFKRFSSPPANTTELEKERNHRRLKHVMMGSKIWNSLTVTFQINIMGGKE